MTDPRTEIFANLKEKLRAANDADSTTSEPGQMTDPLTKYMLKRKSDGWVSWVLYDSISQAYERGTKPKDSKYTVVEVHVQVGNEVPKPKDGAK